MGGANQMAPINESRQEYKSKHDFSEYIARAKRILEKRRRLELIQFLKSETQVVNTIGETYNELAILEFNLRCVALVRHMRQPGLNMRERDGLNCLSQGHIRSYDGFAVRHIERMA
jgi:hypothetical protein